MIHDSLPEDSTPAQYHHHSHADPTLPGVAHVRSWALRAWCWPGNTSDSALIRQVKGDLRGCSLSKVVWVADCGFSSAENRRGWRDLKQVIDLRPVYHQKQERIRAHVILSLARAPPGPHRRERLRRDLAGTAPPTRPHHRRHLLRPRRDLPPAHRDHPCPGRHPRTARHRPAPEDLPAHPGRNRLTSRNATPRYTPSTQEEGAFPHVKPQIRRSARYTASPRSRARHAERARECPCQCRTYSETCS